MLGCSYWLYLVPPGRSRAHRLLDAVQRPVFEAEGVQFTVSVPRASDPQLPLVVDVRAENCWTGTRTIEFCSGSFRSSIELDGEELKQTQLIIPPTSLKHESGSLLSIVLDVRTFGWRGRRLKPRRGVEVGARVQPSETAALLVVGILAWGGGLRLTTRNSNSCQPA